MYITVSEFSEITGIAKDTVYSWKYRENWPEGLSAIKAGRGATILVVSKKYEHFEKIKKEKKR
jgi:hypothetical protein